MKNAFTGSWRITDMELSDEEARDLLGPAYIKFGSDGTGELRFIAVQGWMITRMPRRSRSCSPRRTARWSASMRAPSCPSADAPHPRPPARRRLPTRSDAASARGCHDLGADRAVRADDRVALERLCRYLLRPPLAQERLARLADGRVVCTLRHPWHDGTRHLIFTPHEFLERLAAITPRPHINLLIYRGVLAPRARWRPPGSSDPAVVAPPGPLSAASAALAPPVPLPTARGAVAPPSAVPPPPLPVTPTSVPAPPSRPAAPAASRSPPAAERARRTWAWADLMRRIFAIDVLACAGCGGRLRFLATIEDPPIVTKILAHLGLPTERPALIPARSPPQPDGFDFP